MKFVVAKYPFSMAEAVEVLGIFDNEMEAREVASAKAIECHNELECEMEDRTDTPPTLWVEDEGWDAVGWPKDEFITFMVIGVPNKMTADAFVLYFGPGR
jgi:hypothetical protein